MIEIISNNYSLSNNLFNSDSDDLIKYFNVLLQKIVAD